MVNGVAFTSEHTKPMAILKNERMGADLAQKKTIRSRVVRLGH